MMNCAKCGHMCPVHKVAGVLLIIGGLNWGLMGAFNYNLVHTVFSAAPVIEQIIYVLVGLSAVSMLFVGACRPCMAMMKK